MIISGACMVYDKVIVGKFVDLRSITLDDAEFSYNIRADERFRDTVGQLAPSLEAQKEFIEWQMKEPDDYYFVVLNKKGERIGLYGVYNFHDGMAEVGREVNMGGSVEALEVGLLVNDFCINVLGITRLCCVIYANNPKHISDAIKRGGVCLGKEIRGGHEAVYFEHDILHDNATMKKIRRMIDSLYKKQQAENTPK